MHMRMMHHGHHPPIVIFPMGIIFTVMTSLALTWKIAMALKILAMTSVLDKLGDRLSESERGELEGRIRHHLFMHRCCGHHCM